MAPEARLNFCLQAPVSERDMVDPLTIPVMRPRLPSVSALTPYLRRIDEAGIYSNFGPLYDEFSERLASYFHVDRDQIALLANGTLALQAAVETIGEPGDVWVLPSWTFVATGQAIISARRRVHFADVDLATWAMPVSCQSFARGQVVVAPFGDRPMIAEWAKVKTHTVFDAASCFDACRGIGGELDEKSMLMVSLHATKPLAAGEGAVLIGPRDWVMRARSWGNFGLNGSRVASGPGMNAKISEYHCAVGLASMDSWSEKHEQLKGLTKRIKELSRAVGVISQPSVNADYVTSTWSIMLQDPAALRKAIAVLSANGVETRRWWPCGLADMSAFASGTRDSLAMSEFLSDRVLGLPFGTHLKREDIEKIGDLLLQFGEQGSTT